MKNVTYINASAGSGKTYTLTHLLAKLIKDKEVKPEQVIMTTFSVKAANEMKEEAKKVLYESKQFDEATRIDQAMIGTIHSVAQAFIKKYWFFLGLSPDMGVMDEEDTKFYVSQSLSDLPTDEELGKLHGFCENFDVQARWNSDKKGLDYDFWKEDIKNVITFTTNYEIADYKRSKQESLDYICQFVNIKENPQFTEQELTKVVKEYEAFLETKGEGDENKKRKATLNGLKRGVKDPTIAWYAKMYGLLKKLKTIPPKSTQLRDKLASVWHWPVVYESQKEYIELLFDLAAKWKERYNNYKKEKNLLDFNDMEKYLRDLLNDERVSKEIAEDYRYLFVDEYQDCSPIQVKIFDRVSELMKESYWVGDYKQAIYGFRGSDITLPKAVVDRIASGKDGCKMADPLDTSYRSLPDIVNVCNKTFEKTFEGVLKRDAIVLKEKRINESGITSLRYWKLPSATGEKPSAKEHRKAQWEGLARQIAHLIKDEGAQPNEIAVLNRKNQPMNDLAGELKALDIPASREDMPVLEMQAAPLVMALLSLIASDSDSLAKAQIAYMTEVNADTRAIIEQRLMYDTEKDKNLRHFLDDVPLVKRMLQLRPMLKQQSLAAQVETMVIELDLYNVVKKIGNVSESVSCLNAIIKAAGAYEQHCIRMALPATASGFKDYLSVAKPAGVGDANGVQLHTFHSSKGLQWKYVILTSLQSKVDDPKECVKSSIYGVKFNYTELPSAENPYPEVYIRVMPWIYGSGSSSVDEEIENTIEESALFKQVKANNLYESNRLMYVGMTRPQDVMILALERPAKNCHELQWLKEIGLESVNPQAESDLLGVGCPFKNDTLSSQQLDAFENFRYKSLDEKLKTNCIPYHQPLCEEDRKYVSPSSLHEKGEMVEHYNICGRMKVGSLGGHTSAEAGDCLHQIYCGIEEQIDEKMYYSGLIDSYGLKHYFVDAPAIRTAWESLVDWLTTEFGAAVKVYHERPFTLLRDGQVLTGSIDLVWQTSEGDVLIDFKSCPMTDEYILNPESEHYAGWYAGQLDAYTDALEAAGEKVIKRYIYYPVSGMVCEIGK